MQKHDQNLELTSQISKLTVPQQITGETGLSSLTISQGVRVCQLYKNVKFINRSEKMVAVNPSRVLIIGGGIIGSFHKVFRLKHGD